MLSAIPEIDVGVVIQTWFREHWQKSKLEVDETVQTQKRRGIFLSQHHCLEQIDIRILAAVYSAIQCLRDSETTRAKENVEGRCEELLWERKEILEAWKHLKKAVQERLPEIERLPFTTGRASFPVDWFCWQ